MAFKFPKNNLTPLHYQLPLKRPKFKNDFFGNQRGSPFEYLTLRESRTVKFKFNKSILKQENYLSIPDTGYLPVQMQNLPVCFASIWRYLGYICVQHFEWRLTQPGEWGERLGDQAQHRLSNNSFLKVAKFWDYSKIIETFFCCV
jgi:hypothetical protein